MITWEQSCCCPVPRGLVVVATWSVGSRLGGQKGGVALHVSCSAVTPGELSVPVLGMSYPSVPTKEQTTADSVCFSVRYRAIAGPLVRLVLAPGSSGIGSVSDLGPGSSGASLISTPGSGSGCDSCSGSESGSVGDFGSMLRGVALFVALISGCGGEGVSGTWTHTPLESTLVR